MFFALALTMSAPSVASASIRSDCVHDREAILALEFKAFDQTEGSGWRPLYHNGCYVEVAELLREWRARNGDATPPVISFHEAQMWGYAGRYDLAESLFAQAFRANGSASAVTFNLYVGGNLAFLRRDRAGLEAAVAALAEVPKPAG